VGHDRATFEAGSVNWSLEAAAQEWGVSRRTAYRLAELGLIRVARFGRRMTVPAEEVERVRLGGVEGPALPRAEEAEPVAVAAAPAPLSLAAPRRGRPGGRSPR
jgi:excisionase family DNA binding protein